MIDIILNPKNIESIYIECLNSCFDDWGGPDMYEWCFNRQVGDLKADIMVLKKNSKIIAGSAVTYRKVLLTRNSMTNVGIMTGSWTLPDARRQGCFTKIIEESVALASGKGAVLLLAFVTENNPSFHRLVNAGSSLFPTHYLFSGDNTPIPESHDVLSPVLDLRKAVETIFERLRKYQSRTAHFTYTLKEWQSQFLDRPGEIEFLFVHGTSLAIIEKKGDFDRVLILSLNEGITFGDCVKALLKRALNSGRRLFLFTTSQSWKDECVTLGFEHAPGYVTTLVANERELLKAYPGLPGFPKNIRNKLYEPSSRWYIGSWDVQSGDRM
jgi:hypothetical protein